MDVYDFDGTIYRGDSTASFFKWCLARHPRIITTLPRTAVATFACMKLHVINKTQFKSALYRFLPYIPSIEQELGLFWGVHEKRIGGPCHPQPGDLAISAGPDFLLRGVCERRGLQLIASQVDPYTGKVLGPNCSDSEKVVRFRELFPEAEITHFYSDSHNDDPLAEIAQEAFYIDIAKNTMIPWPKA